MKVILVMVQSVNGKITRGDDPNIYTWTSKEDADFFFSFLAKHKLIVMGSGTYEGAKDKIRPDKSQLRIIITTRPEHYQKVAVAKQLEFRNVTPRQLVDEMWRRGHEKMLLVGGGKLNSSFLEAGLVDEIYLTLEPRIFGKGKSLIANGAFEHKLQLVSIQQLNGDGTLLLHYRVVRG